MGRRFRSFRLRLIALLRWRRQQREYAEELAFHQYMLRERLESEGTPEQKLDLATQRIFGNPSRLCERLTEIRQFTQFENIFRDLGYAARVLRKSPGFTLTAILTIALGIGASTAIFSLINALLLRPLPVPDANQLAVLGYAERIPDYNLCVPLFRAIERNHEAFSGFAYGSSELPVGSQGGVMVPATQVSGAYFTTLGVPPLLGRYLTAADDRPGSNPSGLAAVITEHYWRTALGSDPHVIGRSLVVSKIPFTIVGVMPKRFIGADPVRRPQVFLPLATEPLVDAPMNMTEMGYHAWWLNVLSRVKPGVSIGQANASLASAANDVLYGQNADPQWAPDARKSHFRFFAEPAPGGYTFVRQFFRQPLLAVLVLCFGMVLLACLNLASLLFARSTAREYELATRVAIGATRRRLIQQLLIESLLLSAAGATIGFLAAPFVARALSTFLLGRFDNMVLDLPLDWRVLGAAACATILVAVLIGLAPALQATGRTLHQRLKCNQSTPAALSRRSLLPPALLSLQVALSLVLVIGAGLLATSLLRLYRSGLGFDQRNLIVMQLFALKEPLKGDALIQWNEELQKDIAALPTVRNVSGMEIVPFGGGSASGDFSRPGHPPKQIDWNLVFPGYFDTMRVPIVSGRDFSWSDTHHETSKIILSRSAARLLFPDVNPVGQQLDGEQKKHYQVIGIVGDTKYSNVREPAPAMAYVSASQEDELPFYNLIARVDGPTAPVASAVRRIFVRNAPDIPAPVFSTLSSTLDHSLSAERMMAMLSVFFAACALLVTGIGLYGTLAYRTARRTGEIGVRMALGAQRIQVVSLIFRQNVGVTVIGALVGLAATLLAAHALSSFLYGTSTHDPLVLCGSTLLLALVASAASLAPAIRAACIDPLTAIRTE
jgi:predicted permease